MKIRIGVLGGAFNPIHIDHLRTARAALDAGFVSHVWIMPCWDHKFGKDMVSFEHRVAMVQLAVKDFGDERICCHEFEGNIKSDGSTYNTLSKLKRMSHCDDGRFRFLPIIGLDNAKGIERWHNWEKLIAEFPFLVINRQGCGEDDPNAWYHKSEHFYLDVGEKIGRLSSTEVRYRLENSKDIGGQEVCPAVQSYILKNRLYIK